ncbi:hypothetical protein HMPREF2724_10050 [Corynebacterium sp. HMSC071F07]|uniref:DUF3710 domain-containing protein n=1 Tax=Corynebacterium sp. HMSC071F07 TaxID=1715203 RepID=UPI0008A4425D|nr:DUF3710 domain-containing protein [Corynebacterium sp. HMSC071F07]OFL99768.1 hypothetical protein HMPREF2724_10050 [Corynebacterium sp. HMSC071F07]
MPMWPFSKKKSDSQSDNSQDAETRVPADEVPAADNVSAEEGAAQSDVSAAPTDAPAAPAGFNAYSVEHDAVGGEMGPFDGDQVNIQDFDFEDFSVGLLDLGSMRIPLPKGTQVQVEMGEQGPKMLHIVSQHGRMTPVAFAAPRKPGQWAESATDIINGLTRDGFEAHGEDGPWGTEIVGTNPNGEIRIIGVDGPRWMYRLTLAAPAGKQEQLAELGREVFARTFIYRGEDPILAGNSLPVTLPQQLAEQVQQAMKQRAEGTSAEGTSADGADAQRTDSAAAEAEAEAKAQLDELNKEES